MYVPYPILVPFEPILLSIVAQFHIQHHSGKDSMNIQHNQVFCFISEQQALWLKERKKKNWTNIELLDSDDYYFRLMTCLCGLLFIRIFPALLKWLIGISARIYQYIWHFTLMMCSLRSVRKKQMKERKTDRKKRRKKQPNGYDTSRLSSVL